jgi:adenylylsulfate kinase
MGWLCDQVVNSNTYAIADFICPTPEARTAFGPAHVVWVDRIQRSRYPDTDALFVPNKIGDLIRPAFDAKRPTALFIGRW